VESAIPPEVCEEAITPSLMSSGGKELELDAATIYGVDLTHKTGHHTEKNIKPFSSALSIKNHLFRIPSDSTMQAKKVANSLDKHRNVELL